MSDIPRPDYWSINQLCEMWGFDLNQLHHAIVKYKMRLWINIKNKKSYLHDNVIVREAEHNAVTFDEIKRCGDLTFAELRNEGFTMACCDELEPKLQPLLASSETSGSYFKPVLVRKGNIKFFIYFGAGEKYLSIPDLNSQATDVIHDNFVELCEESVIDPRKSIANLFPEGELYVLLVKCEKDGYVRFLRPACSITLHDIYIHSDEVERIEERLFRKALPVLLTAEYNFEQVKILVHKSLEVGIALCVRIDAISPNNIPTARDIRLSPDQLRQVWQEQPKPVLIGLALSDNKIIESNVGINGLLVDKAQADCYLGLIKSNQLESQVSENILLIEQSEQGYAVRIKESSFATLKADADEQNDIELNKTKLKDRVIKERLKMSLKSNIKKANPKYKGDICNKTGEPQALILKVMCIMIELKYLLKDVTWSTVLEFIEDHISGISELETLSLLTEVNDFQLEVSGVSVDKRNCQNLVSRYKKDVFTS